MRLKRSEISFGVAQVVVDAVMLYAAASVAYLIRDIPEVLALKPKLYTFPYGEYIAVAGLVIPLFLTIYAVHGLYALRITRSVRQEIVTVWTATAVGFVTIIVAIFLKREWFSSRFIILASWALAVIFVIIGRILLRAVQTELAVRRGTGVHRVLLVGANEKARQFAALFASSPEMGYVLVGNSETGILKEIKSFKETRGVDDVIVCDPAIPDDIQEKLMDYCLVHGMTYTFLPTRVRANRTRLSMINGEPVVEVLNTPLDGWWRVAKRILDLLGSLILLVVALPIMGIIALLIRREDDGPILYKNERIGANGRRFFVYKFRYMQWKYCVTRDNPHFEEALAFEKQLIAERNVRSGALYKIKDDPRKTRIGAFIERYSLDELPQLFNVVRGEMSLVGPRPHQAREVERYREYHRRLLTITPGITGLAQVSGRSDLDFEDEYTLDLYYIENWSLWLDLTILLRTANVIFSRRKNSSPTASR